MLKSIFAVAFVAAAASASASTVLFSDDFDMETAALNYTGFAQWTVDGQVDVVNTGTFGITCDGKCVDLDGTGGPGGITSIDVPFSAGGTVRIQFDLSGSQRSAAEDEFEFSLNFMDAIDVASLTGNMPDGNFSLGFIPALSGIIASGSIPGGASFTTYFVEFQPLQATSLWLRFGTTSADRIGPVLDNVLVTQTSGVIPEPATWAMLIAGFGLVGSAMRRRRTAVAA